MRKSRKLKKEVKLAKERLEEIQLLEAAAIKEEKQLLEAASIKIKDLCKKHNFICGVVLTPNDLAEVVKLAATSNENVTIEFRLYPKDN